MEKLEQKPKSIKSIGNVIIVLSAMIIFGNGMGIFSFTLLGFGDTNNVEPSSNTSLLVWIFEHYLGVCMSMIIIGLVYLLGGVFLAKYKLWANKLVTLVSVLLLFIIWVLMILMFITMSDQIELKTIRIGSIVTVIIWSIPLLILIWYLNKQSILKRKQPGTYILISRL
ncbi:MAG: hypothetical protein AB7S69_04580 [Salinivirgaceae bacterium]